MTINHAMVVPPPAGSRPYEPARLGLQASETWEPGANDKRVVLDACLSDSGAWRLSVVGDVVLDVSWGSQGNRSAADVDAPLVGVFAGQISVVARPRTLDGARVVVTLAPSWGYHEADVRRLVTGPLGIGDEWRAFHALVASTLSVRGTVVNLTANERFPLVSGSVLNSGTGYLELTP